MFFKGKHKFIFSGIVIIALLLGGGIVILKNFTSASEADKEQEIAQIKVEQGMGLSEITVRLYEKSAIRSPLLFQIYSLFSGQAQKFKPGVYEFSKSSSVREAVKILTRGPSETAVVIFPGMTLKEADDVLSSSGIIKRGELAEFSLDLNQEAIYEKFPFLKGARSLEGFIYPDTYNFFPASDIETVVSKILDNFEQKVVNNLSTFSLTGYSGDDIIKKLTIASLLEKEVINFSEQRIVAGILENRLKKNMPLQIDATIVYAKCEGRFLNCPNLKRDDFGISSPYNTYENRGLPPAPISNPTVKSIEAAMSPARTAYMYYLSDPKTKKTIFSETFEEHNANRARYLGL